jgi:enoyl-CoA hydratase
MNDASVITTRNGRIGHLLLNRPRTLNALDAGMIAALAAALAQWHDDPLVHAVVIEGAGERAFCAGGDIRAVRDAALRGDAEMIHRFFAEEYALNAAIAAYPKPYVALIDGFCMGGGIGVSVHGQFRVTTEAGQFAMPETAIALFPDVGATYVLPRLPGALGLYLGLTGARLVGADAVHAGLATHFVPRDHLPDLRAALAQDGVAAIAAHATSLPEFSLAPHRQAIDRCFDQDSVAGIRRALAAEASVWASETLAALDRMSPASLVWSHAIIRAGATRTLAQCLEAELALTAHVTQHPDFAEGVRAMVVDKDRAPRWAPAVDAVGLAACHGANT